MKWPQQAVVICLLATAFVSASIADPERIAYESYVAVVGDEIFNMTVPNGYAIRLLTTDMQRPRLFIFDQQGNMLVEDKQPRSLHVGCQ